MCRNASGFHAAFLVLKVQGCGQIDSSCIKKLAAAEMKTAFDLVMVELHKLSLLVVVVSVDNHIVNR